jgi:hypothetical protein
MMMLSNGGFQALARGNRDVVGSIFERKHDDYIICLIAPSLSCAPHY